MLALRWTHFSSTPRSSVLSYFISPILGVLANTFQSKLKEGQQTTHKRQTDTWVNSSGFDLSHSHIAVCKNLWNFLVIRNFVFIYIKFQTSVLTRKLKKMSISHLLPCEKWGIINLADGFFNATGPTGLDLSYFSAITFPSLYYNHKVTLYDDSLVLFMMEDKPPCSKTQ